jgi:uncharacterized protein YjbJ (UPF0337 family)
MGIHATKDNKGAVMNDTPRNTDDAKGRVKEAAGDLTGNDDLKEEGKTDQAAGKVKDVADSAKDKVDDAIDGVRDRVND